MTDKDFDHLIEDALTGAETPAALNEKLILLAKNKQNKKAKIFKFAKAASACAAVFVCATAVLSYFNSDLFSQKNAASVTEIGADKPKGETVFDEQVTDALSETPAAEESLQKDAQASEKRADAPPAPKESLSTDALPTENAPRIAAQTDASAEAELAENASEDIVFSGAGAFSTKRDASPNPDMLFNADYDYKGVISQKITQLISELPFAQEVSFSQLNGDEEIILDSENVLTVVFAAGIIAPEEHGDLFFTVGKVQDGVIICE